MVYPQDRLSEVGVESVIHPSQVIKSGPPETLIYLFIDNKLRPPHTLISSRTLYSTLSVPLIFEINAIIITYILAAVTTVVAVVVIVVELILPVLTEDITFLDAVLTAVTLLIEVVLTAVTLLIEAVVKDIISLATLVPVTIV